MLVFLIPLKSRNVSASWDQACRLFTRTLASACNQTSPDYRVVAVCHELPDCDVSSPRVELIQADYAPPSPSSRFDMRGDMQRKHRIALNRALEYAPSHVMFLDADDLVSNRLAEFVGHHSQVNGWYFRSGYFHCQHQKYLHLERRRFDQWCGSSHIVRPGLLEFMFGGGDQLVFDHRTLTEALAQRGSPIRPLPFKGAIYSVSHGENLNDYESILWPTHPLWRPVRRVLFHRRITPRIRGEFGLTPAG
jgi:hypothetical protein